MSDTVTVGTAPPLGGRATAPAVRGAGSMGKWIGIAVISIIAAGAMAWVVWDGTKAPERKPEVAAKPGTEARWKVKALDTGEEPARARPIVPIVSNIQPRMLNIGGKQTEASINIGGQDLAGAVSVIAPGSGLTFGEPEVSADGRNIKVQVVASSATVPGSYRIVVRMPSGEAGVRAPDVDRIDVEQAPLPVESPPSWVPPPPPRREPEIVIPKAPPAQGPKGEKPTVDPTLARRLAPLGQSGSDGGGGGDRKGGEEGTGGGTSGGVDMSRTKIGTSRARRLADMTMMIPAGTMIGCVLDNAIQTDQPGFVSCTVENDIYGADGTVVLIDRGSQILGEYRNQGITIGKERVFVVWGRVRTPSGVLVEIDSPGTGPLGQAGFGGWVDNHYFERVGIPVLMSVVSFGIETAMTAAANKATDGNNNNNNSSNGYSQVGQTMDNSLQGVFAEMAKIKPTLHVHQGALVQVLLMRDLDMGSTYELIHAGG